MLIASGEADVFITYCTNAVTAISEQPALKLWPVPAAVNVSALYGLSVLRPVSPVAQRFADFVLAAQEQQILASHGFSAP